MAVFGLARRAGCTLMVRNPRVTRGGHVAWWDLPGGSLQAGERLPNALVREWREETGTQAEVGALRFVLDGEKRTSAGVLLYTWRAFFFEVTCRGEPVAGVGIDEVAWVPDADVDARLVAPYHAALLRHLADAGLSYAETTWVEPVPDQGAGAALPRRLLVIAAAAPVGDLELLAREVDAAREAGEAPERIVETLLQVVPYAGYPRAISAFGAVRAALADAPRSTDEPEDREARGRRVFRAVYGETADAVLGRLQALDPVLARWTIEHAYGRVLAREGVLTLCERELLAVSVLTALGRLEDPLLGHMRAALRVGATREQVAGAVAVVPASVGEARKAAARGLLGRV